MNLVEELKLLCAYVLAVADSNMPAQLKFELIFNDKVAGEIEYNVSLGAIYGFVDKDWESHEEEVREFAEVCGKLLEDLDKVDTTTLEGAWA